MPFPFSGVYSLRFHVEFHKAVKKFLKCQALSLSFFLRGRKTIPNVGPDHLIQKSLAGLKSGNIRIEFSSSPNSPKVLKIYVTITPPLPPKKNRHRKIEWPLKTQTQTPPPQTNKQKMNKNTIQHPPTFPQPFLPKKNKQTNEQNTNITKTSQQHKPPQPTNQPTNQPTFPVPRHDAWLRGSVVDGCSCRPATPTSWRERTHTVGKEVDGDGLVGWVGLGWLVGQLVFWLA